jgi:hypothetical protein
LKQDPVWHIDAKPVSRVALWVQGYYSATTDDAKLPGNKQTVNT